MEELLLHPQAKAHLERLVRNTPHAIVLSGPQGSGKQTLASHVSAVLLRLDSQEALKGYPYFKTILPEKGKTSIGIEAVRELQHFTKLKLPGKQSVSRVIYIPDAQQLTTEAQNALLKLLEEPPEGTVFVMTVTNERHLLPTIRSRSQSVTVHRPDVQAVKSYFMSHGHDEAAVDSTYFLSGGLPGLMAALLHDEEHPLKATVQQARQVLRASRFERLCMVDVLAKDKAASAALLFVLGQMAQTALSASAEKILAAQSADDRSIRQWHKVIKACYDAEQAFATSAQAKLILTNLMLSL